MIRSMTGFARAEGQYAWGRLTWELRAVNHRYFDLSLKIPEDLRVIESEVRKRAGAQIRRGKMEAAVRYSRESSEGGALAIDSVRLNQLKEALGAVATALGQSAPPDPVRVLSWPGVVQTETTDAAPMQAEALKLFDQALAEFSATRDREGAGIATHLSERCVAMEAHVQNVLSRFPKVQAAWQEKLRARCVDLGVEVEPSRLEQEVVLVAQRMDVDEEMSRLSSHLLEVRESLDRDEAIGRRLDFLMQELNREANTLSSKSQDGEITREAVEMKVLIEQMREQVQNVE